jgi:hypothetical protein
MFPDISARHILAVLTGGSAVALAITVALLLIQRRRGDAPVAGHPVTETERESWRMPPLQTLPPARLTLLSRTWLIVLRGYLVIAGGLVLVRIAELIV